MNPIRVHYEPDKIHYEPEISLRVIMNFAIMIKKLA